MPAILFVVRQLTKFANLGTHGRLGFKGFKEIVQVQREKSAYFGNPKLLLADIKLMKI